MTKWVASLGLSATGLILALIVFYLILGMFMDVLSMQVATIPITYPIAIAVGVDPIWFGIFIVLMCELGLITPPVGMNLFVVHGIRPDKGACADTNRAAATTRRRPSPCSLARAPRRARGPIAVRPR